ncbi:MAG: hypothetical protein GQ582_12765, partial [Methyloprofundus sp.]|nr:hypothetical protein [Methyloprofundus sp.]
ESLEQPDIILQQSIRDMQDAIDKDQSNLSNLEAQQGQLQQKQAGLQESIADLQAQLQFCLAENNEQLAKSIIKKKLHAENALKTLSQQLLNMAASKKRKQAELTERQEKCQAIREKLALVNETTEMQASPENSESYSNVSQDDIELALLYAKQDYAQQGEKT